MAACFATLWLADAVQASPLLRCQVAYGGDTQTINSPVSSDPYLIQAIDIGGRFSFKAVMVGHDRRIDYIKLYAYLQTAHGDVPIQEARFDPPFELSSTARPLGPATMLYAGPLERELQYQCSLKDD